jgi:peptidoglycan hydrolase-like protein with peptidoglycan-binding domain
MKERSIQVLAIVCVCTILLAVTADCFAAKPVPNNQVKAVQTALKKEGYQVDVDGKMGKNTRAALTQFQKANKLPATGKADKATLKKMGIK